MCAKKYSITQASIRDFVSSERNRIEEVGDESKVFEYVAAQQVLTQYDIDDDETSRGIVGGGNDGGYDGVFLFINETLVNGEDPEILDVPKKANVELHLIQAKYQTSLPEVVIQNWKDSFENLLSGEEPDLQRYCQEIIDFFSLAKAVLSKTMSNKLQVSIQFWAVSLVEEIHPNLMKQAEELKEKVASLIPARNTIVSVNLLTAQELYALLDQAPDEVMTLKGSKEPLCPDEHSAILTVGLFEFNEFTTNENGELKKALFEANIRDYQGNIEVNKAIRKTLADGGAVDFWWLNNGITIVADSVTRDMGNAITLTNPRIVNGLQTSNEIWNFCNSHDASTDERKVLVKCIAADDQSTRAQIIQATNNQSSIPPAYLRSLETIHLQIERYFKGHGLHYDRRKSSCKNEGIPARDIISVPFFGQCLISVLLQQPDYARARPAQILGDNEKYQFIFNEDVPLESYLALGKLAVHVRQYLKTTGLSRGAQNDLIFYVLLASCAEQVGKFEIEANDLGGVVIPTDEALHSIVNTIYEEYVEAGGTSVIAKNSAFVDRIKQAFNIAG